MTRHFLSTVAIVAGATVVCAPCLVNMSYNPTPSKLETEISRILRDVFGDDPEMTDQRLLHYDVDSSMLEVMLASNPSEEHILDFLGIQSRGVDDARIRDAARRILQLKGA